MCPECGKCAEDWRDEKRKGNKENIIFTKCGENFCCMMHAMDGYTGFTIMLEMSKHIIFGMRTKAIEIALQMDFNVQT